MYPIDLTAFANSDEARRSELGKSWQDGRAQDFRLCVCRAAGNVFKTLSANNTTLSAIKAELKDSSGDIHARRGKEVKRARLALFLRPLSGYIIPLQPSFQVVTSKAGAVMPYLQMSNTFCLYSSIHFATCHHCQLAKSALKWLPLSASLARKAF